MGMPGVVGRLDRQLGLELLVGARRLGRRHSWGCEEEHWDPRGRRRERCRRGWLGGSRAAVELGERGAARRIWAVGWRRT